MTQRHRELESEVQAILERRLGLPGGRLDAGDRLAALGMDSLDRTELAIAVERRFEVRISESDVGGAETVGDLVALVVQRIA